MGPPDRGCGCREGSHTQTVVQQTVLPTPSALTLWEPVGALPPLLNLTRSQEARGSEVHPRGWPPGHRAGWRGWKMGVGVKKWLYQGLSGIATFVFKNFAPHFFYLDICKIQDFWKPMNRKSRVLALFPLKWKLTWLLAEMVYLIVLCFKQDFVGEMKEREVYGAITRVLNKFLRAHRECCLNDNLLCLPVWLIEIRFHKMPWASWRNVSPWIQGPVYTVK